MRTLMSIMILMQAVLAGCSDRADPVQADPTFEDFDGDVPDHLGMIRGVVVDAAIRPVVNATITIAGLGATTTSNEKGAFQFTDLEPGTYFLEISRVGFEEVQASTTVAAGVIPDVIKVQLQLNPSSLPHVTTLQAVGHTGCSFLFGITSLRWACDDVDPPLHARFDTGLADAPDAIQAEMTWTSTQQAGDQMRLFVRNANEGGASINSDYIGLISGPSPLTCQTELGENCGGHTGLSQDTWTGRVNLDGAAGCFNGCVNTPLGEAGLGVMIDQDYEAFLTVFRNLVPDDDWTYVKDGQYDVRG